MRALTLSFLLLWPVASAAQEAPSEYEENPAAETLVTQPPVSEPAVPEAVPEEELYNVALLQGLNKVTARISELEAIVGTSVRFGNLEIIVKNCWRAPASERPENAALMEIWDRKPGETPKAVFNGWMFSSSPSLAGLEHPVYDIVVLNCQSRPLSESE